MLIEVHPTGREGLGGSRLGLTGAVRQEALGGILGGLQMHQALGGEFGRGAPQEERMKNIIILPNSLAFRVAL